MSQACNGQPGARRASHRKGKCGGGGLGVGGGDINCFVAIMNEGTQKAGSRSFTKPANAAA